MRDKTSILFGLHCILAGVGLLLLRAFAGGRPAEPLPVLVTALAVAALLAGIGLMRNGTSRRE